MSMSALRSWVRAPRLLHTMFSPAYQYISASDLAEKLKQRDVNPKVVAVVDVRGALGS